jgi:uncharacterized protein YkwD
MQSVRNLRALPLALLLASCIPAPALLLDIPTAGGWIDGAEHRDVERQIHEMINRERAVHGLAPLAFDSSLSEIARDHSHAMALGHRRFGHDHFHERARSARSVVPASRVVGENIASNLRERSAAGPHVVRQWLNSPDHRETIHDPRFAVTGVGVSRAPNGEFYFTQIFVAQRREVIAGR